MEFSLIPPARPTGMPVSFWSSVVVGRWLPAWISLRAWRAEPEPEGPAVEVQYDGAWQQPVEQRGPSKSLEGFLPAVIPALPL